VYSKWIERNINIPHGQGTEAGYTRVSYEYDPSMPDVINAMQSPTNREIVLCYASQCGKSFLMQALRAIRQYIHGASCLWVLPHSDLLIRYSNRIRKFFRANPDVGMLPGKRDHTIREFRFADGSDIVFGLATAPATLAEKPCPDVWFDEIDEIRELVFDPAKLAADRQRNFPTTRRTVTACTPKYEHRGSYAMYKTSRRHERNYPCPHCNAWQPLVFERLRWDADVSNAWYECQECNGHITDNHRYALLSAGRWECLDPGMPDTVMGYRRTAFDTRAETFLSIAREWRDCKGRPDRLRNFFCSWMASPRDVVAAGEGAAGQVDRARAGYTRGTVPDGVMVITCGIDAGADGYSWIVVGWGYNGVMWVLDYGITEGITSQQHGISLRSLLTAFAGLYGQRWRGGLIDSGWNTPIIYELSRALPQVLPCKGFSYAHGVRWATGYRIEQARHTPVRLVELLTDHWQDILQSYMDGAGALWMPSNVGDDLVRHLSNEVRRTVVTPRGSREVWQRRYSNAPQHYRDALCYAIAAGHITGCNVLRGDVATAPAVERRPVRRIERRGRSER